MLAVFMCRVVLYKFKYFIVEKKTHSLISFETFIIIQTNAV